MKRAWLISAINVIKKKDIGTDCNQPRVEPPNRSALVLRQRRDPKLDQENRFVVGNRSFSTQQLLHDCLTAFYSISYSHWLLPCHLTFAFNIRLASIGIVLSFMSE